MDEQKLILFLQRCGPHAFVYFKPLINKFSEFPTCTCVSRYFNTYLILNNLLTTSRLGCYILLRIEYSLLQMSWIHSYTHVHTHRHQVHLLQETRESNIKLNWMLFKTTCYALATCFTVSRAWKGKSSGGNKKTMNTKSSVFQLKKLQLIWEWQNI